MFNQKQEDDNPVSVFLPGGAKWDAQLSSEF